MSDHASRFGFLGVFGAGLVAVLGFFGRIADDIGRLGATGGVRIGAGAAGGFDDAARLGGSGPAGQTLRFGSEAIQHGGSAAGGYAGSRPDLISPEELKRSTAILKKLGLLSTDD